MRTTGTLERRPYDHATARRPESGAAAQTGQGACARAPSRSEPLRLSEAQLALAREYGFPSWPRLKAYVERVTANGPGLAHAFVDEIGYYEDRAEGLRSVVAERSRERHRDRARAPSRARRCERRGDPRHEPGDARLVLAREHGFASWAAFRRHVTGLRESGEPFRRAFRAIQAHDRAALATLLDRYPGLVSARGTNGNDLLGLATNDHAIVARAARRGADPSSANDRGWTPLHQAGYGNDTRARAPAARRRRAHGSRTGTATAARRSRRRSSGATARSPTCSPSARSSRTTCASRRGSAAST